MSGSDEIATARAALGQQLAAYRKAAGHTQHAFAPLTHYGRSSIANVEAGRQNVPRAFWERCDDVLHAAGSLVAAYDRVERMERSRRRRAAEQRDNMAQQNNDVIDVLARVHRLSRTVDPAILDHLHNTVRHVLVEYESLDHARLVPLLLKQRRGVDALLDECGHWRQRRRLFDIAGMVSGLLGYLAVGRGDFPLARAYCLEAFHLGDAAGELNVQAWARGMHSFCEYYARNYEEAVQLATNGLTYAQEGPQSVRLTINCLARALGKLGDADSVHRAVDQAYELMSENDVPAGVPSSVALGCYSAAQTASNAATAYVALGMPEKAQHYVGLALPDITASNSPWSRSLVMLDLATSLIQSTPADLDRAANLVLDALEMSDHRPVISVQQRASDFIRDAANRWGEVRQVMTLRDALLTLSGPVGP